MASLVEAVAVKAAEADKYIEKAAESEAALTEVRREADSNTSTIATDVLLCLFLNCVTVLCTVSHALCSPNPTGPVQARLQLAEAERRLTTVDDLETALRESQGYADYAMHMQGSFKVQMCIRCIARSNEPQICTVALHILVWHRASQSSSW